MHNLIRKMKKKNIIYIISLIVSVGCNTPTPDTIDVQSYLISEVDSLYDVGDYYNALDLFDELISIDPQPDYYYRRAYCKSITNDYIGSIQDYEKSIELGYKMSHSYCNIGVNYSIMKNDSLAFFYATKSLELDPKMKNAVELLKLSKMGMNE
jgi:tetratricopeptide (TPR) repeat protein